MRAIRFHVTGRVQGVWFRAYTQEAAARLGLVGWVRNLRDGRVEGWAEGEDGAIDALLATLADGSPSARVDDLEVEDVTPEGWERFEIRR